MIHLNQHESQHLRHGQEFSPAGPSALRLRGRRHHRSSSAARAAEHRAVHISGYEREGRDFYGTPPWVTDALLRHVRVYGPVSEPCCSDGAMSAVLAAHHYEVISTDIADRDFGTPGIDFVACRAVANGCRSIITVPPYCDTGSHRGQTRSAVAMPHFMRYALALTASVQGRLALLVRLQWIAGRRTADVPSAGPFAATIILTRRIRWFDMGERTNGAQHHHAWVVIDHVHPAGSPPALLFACELDMGKGRGAKLQSGVYRQPRPPNDNELALIRWIDELLLRWVSGLAAAGRTAVGWW